MSERTICIPDRAVPKGRPRLGKRVYTPARTKAWEEQVAWQWRMVHRFTEPYMGRVELIVVFNFAKRPYAADTDNLVKAISDSLEGLAYENDRQIDHIDAWRYKAGSDSVTITVRELGERTETAAELRASRERLRAVLHAERDNRVSERKEMRTAGDEQVVKAWNALQPGDLEG